MHKEYAPRLSQYMGEFPAASRAYKDKDSIPGLADSLMRVSPNPARTTSYSSLALWMDGEDGDDSISVMLHGTMARLARQPARRSAALSRVHT